MPLPILTDVYRCAVNWTAAHGEAHQVNVFHLYSPGGPLSFSDIAGAIDNIDPDAFNTFDTAWSGNDVDILPLDGASPTVNMPLNNWGGTASSGDEVPGLGGVVSFRTAQRGSRGRGRLFLPALQEAAMTFGLIDAGIRSDAVTAWENWRADLFGGAVDLRLVVASYTHSDFHEVLNVSMDQLPGMIRRRRR